MVAFSLLYLGEGLPQGFATAAVTLEFKRLGMQADAIGVFAAAVLAPWAWKWAFGPLVDNLHLPRFGRRTQWVLASQAGMILSLLLALAFLPTEATPDGAIVGVGLFTTLLVVHNTFAACQDVAIDALAVTALPAHERGRVNGLMFGAAQLGIAVGGSGVIAAKSLLGFSTSALMVPLCLALLMMMTLFWVREGLTPRPAEGGLARVGVELRDYLVTVLRTFLLTRRGFLGMVLALLPAGALALSSTLSYVISPTLGMTDDEIAALGLFTSVAFSVACVVGGVVSDRWGRRRTLALFAAATVLPTLWMAWRFSAAGWLYAPPTPPDGLWPRAGGLILDWTIASMVYAVFVGLMYGIRSALYMDIVEPRIAATQFTASMALLNVVTMYTYWWEGKALSSLAEGGWGLTLPQTLLVDCGLGLLFLLVLPMLVPAPRQAPAG